MNFNLDLGYAADPAFLFVALAAVVMTGISKSGLGGGLGQLSVPLMAMFISPVAAAAIMLPILMTIDLFNLWGYRADWKDKTLRRNVMVMVPGALIGIGIGALTFKHVDENMVRLILGVITLFFAMSYFLQREATDAGSKRGQMIGVGAGTMAGFTSFVAHAGGGPVKFFLLPQRLEPRLFVATHVAFFFIINQLKVWPYFWLGQFSPANLSTSLLLLPAVPVGVVIGWKLIKVIKPATFYKLAYTLLFVAGIKLIYDGLTQGGYL